MITAKHATVIRQAVRIGLKGTVARDLRSLFGLYNIETHAIFPCNQNFWHC
jgi:hypothetical protein